MIEQPKIYAGVMNQSASTGEGAILPLRKIGFTLLDDCQGRCSYCYEREFDGSSAEMATRKVRIQLHEYREIITEAKELGLEDVQLSGGEPLLIKKVGNYIRVAKNKGVKVGVFTNGILLRKRLPELISAGVDWVRVGFGGSTADMSPHLRSVERYRCALQRNNFRVEASLRAGITTGFFAPVTRKNINDIFNTAQLARAIGVQYIVFCNYIQLGTPQDKDHMLSVDEHYRAIDNLLDREQHRGSLDVLADYGFFEFLGKSCNCRMPCFGRHVGLKDLPLTRAAVSRHVCA